MSLMFYYRWKCKTLYNDYTLEIYFKLFTTQSWLLKTLKLNRLENIVGNGENAYNQPFSFSYNVFYPF